MWLGTSYKVLKDMYFDITAWAWSPRHYWKEGSVFVAWEALHPGWWSQVSLLSSLLEGSDAILCILWTDSGTCSLSWAVFLKSRVKWPDFWYLNQNAKGETMFFLAPIHRQFSKSSYSYRLSCKTSDFGPHNHRQFFWFCFQSICL